MSFQIKDFVSIVAAQINHARSVTDRVTDFQPGSVVRTLMEAPAVEIEELYIQMFLGLRDAIPVATFLSFGFDKLPAKTAIGYVSISTSAAHAEAITIPVGTAFSTTDGRSYVAIEDVVWLPTQDVVRVKVASTAVGQAGNVAAGVIVLSPLFDADYVIRNSVIDNGRNAETDAEREARFSEFIASLSRGTVSACMYAVRMTKILDANGNVFEYVTQTGIHEEPGNVRIFIYSNQGSPSEALLNAAQLAIDGSRDVTTGAIVPGFRAAGVQVQVLRIAERAFPLSIRIGMADGHSITPAVEQNLGDIFSSMIRAVRPGSVLYLGELTQAMLAVPGVERIVPGATENITCDVGETLVPGTLTITPL